MSLSQTTKGSGCPHCGGTNGFYDAENWNVPAVSRIDGRGNRMGGKRVIMTCSSCKRRVDVSDIDIMIDAEIKISRNNPESLIEYISLIARLLDNDGNWGLGEYEEKFSRSYSAIMDLDAPDNALLIMEGPGQFIVYTRLQANGHRGYRRIGSLEKAVGLMVWNSNAGQGRLNRADSLRVAHEISRSYGIGP